MESKYQSEYDRQEAAELANKAKYEQDPNVRKDYQRLSNDLESEADEIDNEATAAVEAEAADEVAEDVE